MNIKKGDNVIVLSGADKGKTGKVLAVFPKIKKVVVEGVNIKKHHQRRNKSNQKGQKIEKTLPLFVSKVMLTDKEGSKGIKVGKKLVGNKWVRINKKSGKEI